MGKKVINLFMWGYQSHFRSNVEILAKGVLTELGARFDEHDVCVFLVGAKKPGSVNRNPVCIEPEDGKWALSLFDSLLEDIELMLQNHPYKNMFYTDETSMREKPERMRRSSVGVAVAKAIKDYGAENNVTSFCGDSVPVGDFYVTPVIQLSNSLFQTFPPLPSLKGTKENHREGYRSMIHAAMSAVLDEACIELTHPDPGRSLGGAMRRAEEVARIAARTFMRTPGISISKDFYYGDLFDGFNLISSLLYEKAEGIGHVILSDPANEALEYQIRFKQPVPFQEPRWARKVLQLAAPDVGLIADCGRIYGLGHVNKDHDVAQQDIFTVEFLDHYHWELRCGDQILLRSQYGTPKLPSEIIDAKDFKENYARLFPLTSAEDHSHIWNLFNIVVRQNKGSMIVVADDASDEARRLQSQGTVIEPVKLTEQLLLRVIGIDGSIILSPTGVCYAIGVILDGFANDHCTPSRGSRFNSAVRYVDSGNVNRLAIVVSDDRTVDMFPVLPPRISRKRLEHNIAELEAATLDNYHSARNWLDSHRFYLNESQCSRVNSALDRLDDLPKEVGEIHIKTERFIVVYAKLDNTYFID